MQKKARVGGNRITRKAMSKVLADENRYPGLSRIKYFRLTKELTQSSR